MKIEKKKEKKIIKALQTEMQAKRKEEKNNENVMNENKRNQKMEKSFSVMIFFSMQNKSL